LDRHGLFGTDFQFAKAAIVVVVTTTVTVTAIGATAFSRDLLQKELAVTKGIGGGIGAGNHCEILVVLLVDLGLYLVCICIGLG